MVYLVPFIFTLVNIKKNPTITISVPCNIRLVPFYLLLLLFKILIITVLIIKSLKSKNLKFRYYSIHARFFL